MKLQITTYLLVATFIIGGLTQSFSQTPEQLYQKGLIKEEGEGALNEAIDIYNKIVDNQDADKSLQAKALLHIGMCYEKQGTNEAIKAYQLVLNNFPGQEDEVAVARERLKNLNRLKVAGVAHKSLTLSKVMSGGATIMYGSPSPDGRFITYSEDENMNLVKRELSTGKISVLTKKGEGDSYEFNLGSIVSPNSKHIAYAWYKNNSEIRLINVDDPKPKVLYSNKDEDVYPCAWSPDGKTIYAKSYLNKTGQCRILAINVGSGNVQILKTFDFFYWLQLSVSPDNQTIAYDLPKIIDGEMSDIDIHLISTDGKTETSLIHPANDHILGWFPDKNKILFKSDRSGTWDAWTVSVLDGNVSQDTRRVLTDIGKNAFPMGFTKDGIFYYSNISRKFNVFIAPFDPIEATLSIELSKPLLGSVRSALWSPDGSSLALINEQWDDSIYLTVIQNIETVNAKCLANRLSLKHIRWSPDGKMLLAPAYDKRKELEDDYIGGIYSIGVESGNISELLTFSKTQENYGEIAVWALTMAIWSKDQKSIYYTKNNQLIARKLATGKEEVLLQNQKISSTLNLSSDGKKLLFCSEDTIYTLSIPREKLMPIVEVYTSTSSIGTSKNAIWSPDDKYIFFTEDTGDGSILWRISTKGKDKKHVWQSKVPINSVSIHPDGQKIVITTFNQESEIWKVDNLLLNEDKKNN